MTTGAPMIGHYDPTYVFISFLIAQLSAYAALDLTGRVASSESRVGRTVWLGGGAVAMGVGIWSMHYIGMLAFRMPDPVLYNWPLVLLSMVVAILASAAALWTASRSRMGAAATVAGSLVMGGGIASMHYIGMAAMRMPATTTYSVPLVLLSIALAVVIALVALRFSFAGRLASKAWTWQKGLSAFLMGLAIPVMHFTGMEAASFHAAPMPDLKWAINISDVGACYIAAVALVMLSLVMVAVVIDRRFSDHAREIKGSEERYRRIISSAFDAFVGMNAEGDIIDWNEQASVTFGWTRAEALGRPATDILLFDEEYVASGSMASRLSAVLTEGRLEMQGRHKSGRVFPVEIAASAIQGGERPLLAAFVRDVTDRKAFEQQMQDARVSAEEASRAKSEFLANMSHEIRTPLNGVIGMTDLALETELTREQRDYIETAKLSADSLLGVINDILDFSKIEAGKIELETMAFDLRECIESTLKTLALRADEKGLELLCDIEGDVPEMVMGDPARLRQVVTNLVGNAIKFTDRGEVFVKASVDGSADAPLLRFSVCDTGIGIAPQKIDHIFESFNQADTSTTRQYGGTGLGLTISRRLIELMDGRIWAESEPGRGSQFHFTIPAREATRPAATGSGSVCEELAGTKVLIIDDNKTNRRILEGVLKRWGMKAGSAADGPSGIRMLMDAAAAGDPYRLILTDMHMPKMDGFMVAEELNRSRIATTATVMMLSSGGHRGDAKRCQELGISAYLLKPVRQTELRMAIARALDIGPAHEETMITQQTLRAARPAEEFLDILLAEDNEINQKLAVRLLEKRGHAVTVVANGSQAVEALAQRAFDLVLMDVQMPEMDGIEATAEIRRRERQTGGHQPIVAMTALVMKGDRERCLEAKMDGYLSKPIRPQELDEMLETYSVRKRESLQHAPERSGPTPEVVDFAELTARVEGDVTFVNELIDVLREDGQRKLAELQTALSAGDAARVKQTAHSLKGALANVSARRAAALAAQMEAMGAACDLGTVDTLLIELRAEFGRVIETLTVLCEGQTL